MRQLIFLGILLFTTISCVTERANTSPLASNFSSEIKDSELFYDVNKNISVNINNNVNAAEISNLVATFPTFKNENLNEEIQNLKYGIQNYLYAADAGNAQGTKRNLQKIENSYKKIQKLRKSLDSDDNELLNRYLVKIKTNITFIEDSFGGNTK